MIIQIGPNESIHVAKDFGPAFDDLRITAVAGDETFWLLERLVSDVDETGVQINPEWKEIIRLDAVSPHNDPSPAACADDAGLDAGAIRWVLGGVKASWCYRCGGEGWYRSTDDKSIVRCQNCLGSGRTK